MHACNIVSIYADQIGFLPGDSWRLPDIGLLKARDALYRMLQVHLISGGVVAAAAAAAPAAAAGHNCIYLICIREHTFVFA